MNSLRCFLLIALSCQQLAAQNKEWDIRLTNRKDLSAITPESISADSLVFSSSQTNSAAVEISQIKEITYRVGPSNRGRGFVIGLLAGGAVGFVGGLIADGNSKQSNPFGDPDENNYRVILPVAGGIAGGFMGYGIAESGRRSLDLSLMTNDEKREAVGNMMNAGSTSPSTMATKQTQQRDVVYLKNGSIIKGSILEMIPDSTLRIVTTDSSLFIFRMSEVERVTKEAVSLKRPVSRIERERIETNDKISVESGRLRFGLHLGAGFPMGEFGSTTEAGSGLAKAGFVFGGELDYQFNDIASYLTSVSVAFNAFDDGAVESASGFSVDAGSWVTIWPMTGIRLSPRIGGNTVFYVQGQVGLLIGTSPELTVSSLNVRATQPSATAAAFAFSVGAGFLAADRVEIGGRYLYGSPEYEVTASAGSQSGTGKFKQPTGMLLLTIGVML